MNVGIDARELEGKPTGVGVYLRNILERLRIPNGARLQLYFKQQIPSSLPDVNAERILLKSSGGNLRWQQWKLWRTLAANKVKLFFSPANSGPFYFSGIQVVTIHDLSFFRFPEWFSTKERIARQLATSLSLRQADRIYVVSSFIREELVARFHIPPGKVLVTPNGVSQKPFDPSIRPILRKSYGLENEKIILYVGSIFNRRHVPVLIEAMSNLDPNCILVIIGENRTFPLIDLPKTATKFGVEHRVKLLNYVSDKVVQDYYQMADVFVYLSDYEGFGIPPLEAMSYGIPTVLSANPAMDQVFHDGAHFVERIHPVQVSEAISRCIVDSDLRSSLVQAGKNLVDRYNWDNTAATISQDWERLLAACS